MAPLPLLFLFAFLLPFSTESQVVKSSVSCLDCTTTTAPHHFSGIRVGVKCDGVEKLVMTEAESDGSFESELPTTGSTPPANCVAKLLGGQTKLYALRTSLVSNLVKANNGDDENSYTTSTPLAFYTACPRGKASYCNGNGVGSSKTVDLPLPREWGLAPTSYYLNPFIPIIGIP
ncbi:unnamed protein product [Linum trigynum]|uniref:Uncharacterized protein n=1 Tax=Linum trigynum TaxID=586398 RepID=A0AAV2G0Y7_9ROSI